ncbi:MAG: energy transducer TonB [Bacteroidota bacterium]
MYPEINNIRLKFRCEVAWNSMTGTDGKKFCNACQKTVYDFTDAKQQEFLQILAENGNNICGRFGADQMAPAPIRMPVWQKWVSAALVLIGINLFNTKAHAQGMPVRPTKQLQKDIFNGFVATENMAEFKGGQGAFMKFMSKHIQYKKGAVNGKVFAQFMVKKDGTLSNIKIVRGISPVNDQEVVRVLKLSPKWKPARNNGKVVESQYTVPVNFQRG